MLIGIYIILYMVSLKKNTFSDRNSIILLLLCQLGPYGHADNWLSVMVFR